MSKIEGINPDERVVYALRCRLQKFAGDLVVTDKGIVFIKYEGTFITRGKRLHDFPFETLGGIRIEKQGLFGTNIAIDTRDLAWGNRTHRFSCSDSDAKRFIAVVENQKQLLKTPEEVETIILSLVKPKGEADLMEVSRNLQIRDLIARLQGLTHDRLPDIWAFNAVRDIVVKLIAKGSLDGIITDDNKFVSNALLARKSVQYQVVLDFASIYSQLENKGIVLQTLECPSCNGKLEYPKDGDTTTCQFCGATVHAVDVFKKFKELL
ncbi:MAG: PH domain-containing protein [Candidatus Thorarchaeota archaeon]